MARWFRQGVRLEEAIASGEMQPGYTNHPLVLGSTTPVVPVSLYMDGVPYSLTDTVVGVWMINMITGLRHLVALVRKRMVCRCGCGGWDTYFALLQFLRWSFRAMANGIFPSARHDGRPWSEQDHARQVLGGTPLRYKCAIVCIKGDWAEFCERLGFPTWASGLRPCFLCNASKNNWHEYGGTTVFDLPFRVNTDDDFEQACRRCELNVEITAHQHRHLVALLHFDTRSIGSHGRALKRDFPELHLRAGDRLDPSDGMFDTLDFEAISEFPCTVLFWRPSLETLCKHRCPLWDASIGVTAVRCIAVDLLHALFLGPMQTLCRYIIWELLKANVFGVVGESDQEGITVAIMCLRTELMQWYDVWARNHPADVLSRLADLTRKMLGSRDKPKLKTKAMETFWILRFLIDTIRKFRYRLSAEFVRLQSAAEALEEYVGIAKSYGPRLPASALQAQ